LNNENATGLSLAAEDEILASIRAAWAEILAIDDIADVPLDTNFLEAAGSSLLLIMLWELLHPMTDGTLRVSDLYQHSTVRAQAALIAGDREAPAVVGTAQDRSKLLGRARRSAGTDGSRT
jgi:hypothetical protein